MVKLDGRSLTPEELYWISKGESVFLDEEALKKLDSARRKVLELTESDIPVYALNTGVGKLATVRISKDELYNLQANILRSHAAGVGEPLSLEDVRAIMALKLNSFLRGHSGVSKDLVLKLFEFLERGIIPVVPRKGSVGASGDLAPLAHIALPLMGEGEVYYNGERYKSEILLKKLGISPYKFGPKEGIAFINGTQASTAHLSLSFIRAVNLFYSSLIIFVMTFDALLGIPYEFDLRIAEARPHRGQLEVTRFLQDAYSFFPEDRLNMEKLQDAYSLRCSPQVLGSILDLLYYIEGVLKIELNSSTDNPLIFEDGDVISGGNFHGQPVSFAADILSIVLTTLSSLSERRTYRLLTPELSEGLPPFLVKKSGLNSGLMMLQVTQASLVSENRVLSHPASVDSIPTSGGQEDFVSMSMGAALKAREILENAERVLTIELFSAYQALLLRDRKNLIPGVIKLAELLSKNLRRLEEDRIMQEDLENALSLIRDGTLLKYAKEAGFNIPIRAF